MGEKHVNPALHTFLAKASAVMTGEPAETLGTGVDRQRAATSPVHHRDREPPPGVHVGVDLGTAYTVLVVLDQQNQPLAGEYRFAQRGQGHPACGPGGRL
jgi:hypothetical protein